jgi:hypothetical protein
MKAAFTLLSVVFISATMAAPSSVLAATTVTVDPNPPEKTKNWTPPAKKIYAQALSDDIMTAHPELISVTFHGVPPGQKETYTMFAGSYPHRIGNPDDADDIDVITKGITIVDPRWHRIHDTQRKFCRCVMRTAPTSACSCSLTKMRLTPPRPKRSFSWRLSNCAMDCKNAFRPM